MKVSRVLLVATILASVIITCLLMTLVLGCQKEVKPADLNSSDV